MEKDLIRFSYEKAALHRNVHVDGAWATITPQGEIQIALFNDIRPLPESLEISPGLFATALTDSDDDHDGVVREVEFTAVLRLDTARRVIDLLNLMVEHVEEEAKIAQDVANEAIEVSTTKAEG